jgi:rubredoxin-NAD+ reductase
MNAPIVIIGSGLAAYSTLREFRKLNTEQEVVVITQESGDFYSKPMLSTAFANKKNAEQLITTPKEKMIDQLHYELFANAQVESIDPKTNMLHFVQQGKSFDIHFSKLVLAIGADPVRLPISGSGAQDMLSINDLQDYATFREKLKNNDRVAIIGAGLIGCEFANDLSIGGHAVEVIDISPTPLGRLLPPELASALQSKLSNLGVMWHLGTSSTSIDTSSKGTYQIHLANDEMIEVDIVLSAVGLRPRTELAKKIGVNTNRGIVVNRRLESSTKNIFAIGDCAEVDGHVLPYVMPIMNAAKILAANLLGDEKTLTYPAMPVMVKTPALPLIISPPAQGAKGAWHIETIEDGLIGKFIGTNNDLLGFALAGSGTKERASLTPLLPAILA